MRKLAINYTPSCVVLNLSPRHVNTHSYIVCGRVPRKEFPILQYSRLPIREEIKIRQQYKLPTKKIEIIFLKP
jgi:hypothetical protein